MAAQLGDITFAIKTVSKSADAVNRASKSLDGMKASARGLEAAQKSGARASKVSTQNTAQQAAALQRAQLAAQKHKLQVDRLALAQQKHTLQLQRFSAQQQRSKQISGSLYSVMTRLPSSLLAGAVAFGGLTNAVGKFDRANQILVDGTGATGKALDALNTSVANVLPTVGVGLEEVSQAVADLNTFTGRTGPGLEALATHMLKAGISGKTAGSVFHSFNVTGDAQFEVLEKLNRAQKALGPSTEAIAQRVGAYKADMDALGLSMDQQIALAGVSLRQGIRMDRALTQLKDGTGGWGEKINESVGALTDQSVSIEASYNAGETWLQRIQQMTNNVTKMLVPVGDSVSMMGDMGQAALGMGVIFPGVGTKIVTAAKSVATAAKGMWGALTGVGLVVAAGAALYAWRDKVAGAFASVIEMAGNFIASLLGKAHALAGALGMEGLQGKILEAANAVQQAAGDAAEGLRSYAASFEEPIDNTDALSVGMVGAKGSTESFRGKLEELATTADDVSKKSIKPLSTNTTVLEDRIREAKEETTRFINELIGGQGLVGAYQLSMSNTDLLATSIGGEFGLTNAFMGMNVVVPDVTRNIDLEKVSTDNAKLATDEWSGSLTDLGSEMVDKFIPGPMNKLGLSMQGIIDKFQGDPGGLKGAFSSFSSMVTPGGLLALGVGLLIGHFDKIIGAVQKLIGWLGNAFGWLGKVFGFGGRRRTESGEAGEQAKQDNRGPDGRGGVGGIPSGTPGNIPGYPGFATGAIVNRPMVANIAEREPEAVIPLSKLKGLFGGPRTIVVKTEAGRELLRFIYDEGADVGDWIGADR